MSKDSVLGLFRQHADTHPERPALVDRERSFSYRELDRLSDRLAAHLARRGVARGERLPLLAERSAELVIAILAAAKCAAAYVPVDRRQPDRRKQEILRQCQPPWPSPPRPRTSRGNRWRSSHRCSRRARRVPRRGRRSTAAKRCM